MDAHPDHGRKQEWVFAYVILFFQEFQFGTAKRRIVHVRSLEQVTWKVLGPTLNIDQEGSHVHKPAIPVITSRTLPILLQN